MTSPWRIGLAMIAAAGLAASALADPDYFRFYYEFGPSCG